MGKAMKSRAGSRDDSIREKAYRHIQQLIASGKLAAGSCISELTLAKELGSSRSPIREAMNRLAAEGFLEQSAGGGMVVARLHRDDLIELYDLREALEVYSVGKIAALPLRPADKDRLQHLVDEIPKLKAELESSGQKELNSAQMERFLACDFGFHALLMSMTQNQRLQKVVSETRLLIRIFSLRREGHDAQLLESVYQYHQRVLDAVANQNRELAMRSLAEHIQASQREQLNVFDHSRREASLLQSIPTFFNLHNLTPRT
jgi:DNA-binding GntR family transcriptional regulator